MCDTDPGLPAILAPTEPSRAGFARFIGAKKATQVNREQGLRQPVGPARGMLVLIA